MEGDEYMTNLNSRSRTNKYKKRRRNNKTVAILLVLSSILIIIFISTFIFKEKDDSVEIAEKEQNSENSSEVENELADDNDEEQNHTPDEDIENRNNVVNNSDVETEQVDSSDNNVIEAYKGDWVPLRTGQTGLHTTVFSKTSKDWEEIIQAVLSVTSLDENNLEEHWIGNNGEQKVVATVSDQEIENIYRVYLSWIDGEGWQPTLVEKLKTVDV